MTPTRDMDDISSDGRILGLLAFLAFPVALLAPKGMAVLFGLGVVLVLVSGLLRGQKIRLSISPGLILCFALAVLSLASALWSMTPEASFKKGLVLLLVLFGGLSLSQSVRRLNIAGRRLFDVGMIAGGILGFLIIAVEILFESPIVALLWQIRGRTPEHHYHLIQTINQGAAVSAIFLLLWTLALWRIKGATWASIGFAVFAMALVFCQADSHKIALALGLVAALVVYFGNKIVLKGLAVLFIVSTLSAPWSVSVMPDPLQAGSGAAVLPNSSQHRLVIWQATVDHIFQRPWLGSGFDTARAFYNKQQKVKHYYGGKGEDTIWVNNFEPIPLHPHNGVLQVWLELGVIGALLLSGGILFVVRNINSLENRFQQAMVLGSFVTGLVIFAISYGAWQSWWMATIWLLLAFGSPAFEEKTK
ncbi:MAG: O-antigen ligase family protein [Rhodospirillales bacterium]|nr:O-antigen ligase family protein [Rhodospirillales bacterium]